MYKEIKRRKYQKLFFLIAMLSIFIIQNQTSHGWDNCPFGEVNENYPGSCGRYIDTDNDNICDLSQPHPEYREKINEENNDENNSGYSTNSGSKSKSGINYFFVPIAAFLFIIYLTTLYLSRKKKIKPSQHKRIWNFTLLITFLISGAFGIILAIIISYGIKLSFYSNLLFWHVEMGISMAIISMFHIIWHLKYFKKIFQSKK
jgi:hypothetical protein